MNRGHLVVLTATATAALLSGTQAACGPADTSTTSTTSGPAAARVFTSPSPAGVPRPTRPRTPRARSASVTARVFATAYGRYELGEDGPSLGRQLREAASAQLAAGLLAQPVRGTPPNRSARRPVGVLLSSTGQPADQLAATVIRDDASSLNLQLARPAGAWVVIAVSPGQVNVTRGAVSKQRSVLAPRRSLSVRRGQVAEFGDVAASDLRAAGRPR